MTQREELKLVYRKGKLERIELEGERLGGLSTLIKDVACPSIEELRETYELIYDES
ncbi:MAG: hypothetical protein AABW93_01745 [Nanoarchaeota archaeon]